MKFTVDWLKNHLETKFNNNQIIDKLTNIGLEVESFENSTSELDTFIVAKIINAKTHPNAKNGLLTVYAPPGSIIPKNQMKLSVSKIRGVTSYGMLCSESELLLSNESDGIIAVSYTHLTLPTNREV